MPNTTPMAMPSRPPKTAITTDSSRIMRRVWRRLVPTARSRPISRVRSITDSARVLMMPSAAMMIEQRQQHRQQRDELVDALLRALLHVGLVLDLEVRVAAQRPLDGRLRRGVRLVVFIIRPSPAGCAVCAVYGGQRQDPRASSSWFLA